MPIAAMKIDPLHDFREGVVRTDGYATAPIPLKSTKIDVAIKSGFATVSTTRVFRNDEATTIEATLTFPVPVDCVVHGVRVDLDGRRLVAVAQAAEQARQTYETAIDTGKTAVLHEEKLKGVHTLSIAHIPPGKEVAIEVVWSKPLSYIGDVQTLRIPTTVAEIYGRSPLIASDDLAVHDSLVFDATLAVTVDSGSVRLDGGALQDGSAKIGLDRPILLSVTDATSAPIKGHTADGRSVALTVSRGPVGEAPLRAEILFDNSGSTNDRFDGETRGSTVWELSSAALQRALAETVAEGDRVALSEFNHHPKRLGEATGAGIVALTRLLRPSSNGTEIGKAIKSADAEWATDIVLITDGRSHALDVHGLAANGKRVSVVLCGANSLEAHVGHLAALTGGIIVVAGADNIDAALKTVIGSLRTPATPAAKAGLKTLPPTLTSLRGGAEIKIAISGKAHKGAQADAAGAYAAFLALPLLEKEAAAAAAVANGLCTHLTSLVVVDEAGEAQEGLPNQRKVPLSAPIEASMSYFASACAPALSANAGPAKRFMAASPGGRTRSALRSFGGDIFGSGGSGEKSIGGSGWSDSFSGGNPFKSLYESGPKKEFGAAGDTPFSAPKPAAPSSLSGLARRIDWGAHAAELARGSADPLDAATKRAVSASVGDSRIVALAAALGLTATQVVIALLARSVAGADRSAARIARLALDKADKALVEDAMKALGL